MKFITHAMAALLGVPCIGTGRPCGGSSSNAIGAINVAQQGNESLLRIDLKGGVNGTSAGIQVW